MSISNPNNTTGDLEPCGSASMASDQVASEPLKPSFSSSTMPLVSNMDICHQLMQSHGSATGGAAATSLTATTYKVIRLHLRSREPSDRISAGAEVDRPILKSSPKVRLAVESSDENMNQRKADSKSPKPRKALANSEADRPMDQWNPRRFDSKSAKVQNVLANSDHASSIERNAMRSDSVRQAVTSPRQAVTQPRQSNSNMELEGTTRVPNPSLDEDHLSFSHEQNVDLPHLVDDVFDEEMPSCSGYSSANDSWFDSQSYTMDSVMPSGFNSRNGRISPLAKKHRLSMTHEEWLMLKRKEAWQRHRQRRREAHRLAAAEETRKQMSEKCYIEWLASKQKSLRHSQPRNDQLIQGSIKATNRHLPQKQVLSSARPRRDRTSNTFRTVTEAVSARVHQWERNKMIEEDRRRLTKRHEQAKREAEAEERRRLSKKAWDRWLVKVAGKSSPNRGRSPIEKKGNQQSNEHIQTGRKRRTGIKISVPPSIAQRALRQRLNNMDGVQMYRNRR